MKDPNTGELSGVFVDATQYIAEQLKVNVEFVEVDLAKFAAGLQTGAYDVSIGPTFRTIPRASSCAFTRTIFYLGYDGVVAKGKGGKFVSEADIDQPGVTVAVKDGSAIHRYALDNYKKAKVIVLSGTDLTLPLQAVSSGQADVGLMNEHTVEFYHRQHPEVELILEDKPIQIAGMSWAVRSDGLGLAKLLRHLVGVSGVHGEDGGVGAQVLLRSGTQTQHALLLMRTANGVRL